MRDASKYEQARSIITKFHKEHGRAITRKELLNNTEAEILGLSKFTLERAYYERKQSHAAKVESPAGKSNAERIKSAMQRMQVTLEIPEGGLTLKLNGSKGMIGTFLLNKDNFTFIKANGRSTTQRGNLGYERANSLFEHGILLP